MCKSCLIEAIVVLFVIRDACMAEMDVLVAFDSDSRPSISPLLLSILELITETESSMDETTVLRLL